MADQFIGEIRIFAGNFAPKGWAFCNGDLIPISQNTALFSLLGTTYGGDGKTNFALPDLRGRAPMHQGTGPGLTQRILGDADGVASVTLLPTQMPAHTHQAGCVTTQSNEANPSNAVWAANNAGGKGGGAATGYQPTANTAMNPAAIAPSGGSQPHNNMQPYLGINFIIALQGEFPMRP